LARKSQPYKHSGGGVRKQKKRESGTRCITEEGGGEPKQEGHGNRIETKTKEREGEEGGPCLFNQWDKEAKTRMTDGKGGPLSVYG